MRKSTWLDYIMTAPVGHCSATELAEVLQTRGSIITHDEISDWLDQEQSHPAEIWESVKDHVRLNQGYLIIDDTVVRKPEMNPAKNPLVKYYYTEDGQRLGINIISLIWLSQDRKLRLIIDQEIIDPREVRTKNEVLREMLERAKTRGFTGVRVVFDSWYANQDNFSCVSECGFDWVTRLKKNRLVYSNQTAVHARDLPRSHSYQVSLRNTGLVSLFITQDGIIIATSCLSLKGKRLMKTYAKRWPIEEAFRILKQVYHLADCQARKTSVWVTHVHACALVFNKRATARLDHYALRSTNRIESIAALMTL
jgi:putative transposase